MMYIVKIYIENQMESLRYLFLGDNRLKDNKTYSKANRSCRCVWGCQMMDLSHIIPQKRHKPAAKRQRSEQQQQRHIGDQRGKNLRKHNGL